MANTDEQERGIFAELRDAGVIIFAAITGGVAVLYGVVMFATPFAWSRLGQFGDSFGALSALLNSLALAALVATVVLQSRELRDTRKELKKQAEAQQAYADAAHAQLTQTRELELLKIRPLMKAEWFEVGQGYAHLRIRNVGLGAAIVDEVRVRFAGAQAGIHVGDTADVTANMWNRIVKEALEQGAPVIEKVTPLPIADHNRAIAPGEPQAIVQVQFRDMWAVADALTRFTSLISLTIEFRSIAGETFTTQDQFNPD